MPANLRMHTNLTNKKIKRIPLILTLFIIIIPVLTFAQGGFIPCDKDCGYSDLLKLVNNVIDWIIIISTPVAAGVFAWAGIKYMTTGISDQKSVAKEMLRKVLFGFVFILAAWIIVTTITKALLKDSSIVPVEGAMNKSINFYT